MPQVTVTEYTKEKLLGIQCDEEHTSMDSVIRTLVQRNEYNKTIHTIVDDHV